MSYAIAPTFEGNRLGQRNLRLLSGVGGVWHGLGAISSTMSSMAVASGYSQSDLDLLSSVGATDQDIANLMSGIVTLQQLYASYGVSFDSSASSGAGVNPAAPPPAPAGPQSGVVTSTASGTSPVQAQSPKGSTLVYSVTYSQNISTPAPNQAMAQLQAMLPTSYMSVVSSQLISNTYLGLGSATIQFTVQDQIGHQLISDAKSVLDSLMNKITYNSVTGSQLGVVSAGPTPMVVAATPAPSSFSLSSLVPSGLFSSSPAPPSSWLASNWPYLALGLGVVVVLGVFEGRR